jgi:hypothetical protein
MHTAPSWQLLKLILSMEFGISTDREHLYVFVFISEYSFLSYYNIYTIEKIVIPRLEIETSCIDWTQLSRLHLKIKTESCVLNKKHDDG